MINFTVYSADCVGNSGNCLYPNKMIVTDKESFIKATKIDHVTAKYKGNYRSKDNFESSDCIPLDCDNDHSDNPNEWVTPLDIALEIPGVVLQMKSMLKRSIKIRFHILRHIHLYFIPIICQRSVRLIKVLGEDLSLFRLMPRLKEVLISRTMQTICLKRQAEQSLHG